MGFQIFCVQKLESTVSCSIDDKQPKTSILAKMKPNINPIVHYPTLEQGYTVIFEIVNFLAHTDENMDTWLYWYSLPEKSFPH